jgi:hypothetical protein
MTADGFMILTTLPVVVLRGGEAVGIDAPVEIDALAEDVGFLVVLNTLALKGEAG